MVLHTLTHFSSKLIGIGVPGCAPALRHHLLAVDVHLDIAAIVENKLIRLRLTSALIATFGFDKALVSDGSTHQVDALGEVLDAAVIRLQCNLRLRGGTIFVIDTVLITDEFFPHTIHISTCQMTSLTSSVVELEGAVQLQIVVGIAKAAVAVAVPQQTIVLIREHKGD